MVRGHGHDPALSCSFAIPRFAWHSVVRWSGLGHRLRPTGRPESRHPQASRVTTRWAIWDTGATGLPLPTFILASGGASSTPIPLTTRSLGGSPRLGVSKSLRVQVGRGFISPCRIMGASGLLSLQGGPRSHPHHPIPSLAFVCLPGGLRSDLGSAGDTESR
jgi:hypothetical protein